jgi:hypothetical protein
MTQSSWYPAGALYVIPPDGEIAYSYRCISAVNTSKNDGQAPAVVHHGHQAGA